MVVCKFFLQGTCKFGEFCKFEHQLDNYGGNHAQSSSILRQSTFSGTSSMPMQKSTSSSEDTSTLVKSVVNDMNVAEKGGQWLLSSYAPFKEKPAFPGFEDQSFEEIRFAFYDAQKNGTVEQFKQQLQSMLQDAVIKLKALQNPSPDIVNVLKTIYNTPVASSNSQKSGMFGQQNSVFGGQQNTSSIFGAANKSLFGSNQQQSNTPFGTSSSSIFGGNAQPNNLFGQQKPQQSSSFGGPAEMTNIFSKQNQGFGQATTAPQQGGSIFGGQQNNQAVSFASVQGASGNSPFGGQSPSNVFGNKPLQTNSPFGQVQPNSNSPFGQPSSVFGNTPQTGGVNTFTASPNTVSPFGQQAGPFGNPASPTNATAFGNEAPKTNMFGAVVQNNIFGGNTAAQTQQQSNTFGGKPAETNQSVFGQPQTPPTGGSSQYSQSIFGAPAQNPTLAFQQQGPNQPTQANIFGGGQQTQAVPIDESIYSKLEDLTDIERKWFESDDLDISNIPEKPPTYQMCF